VCCSVYPVGRVETTPNPTSLATSADDTPCTTHICCRGMLEHIVPTRENSDHLLAVEVSLLE